jgi:hypothetical protein
LKEGEAKMSETNGNGNGYGSLSTRAMLTGLSISLWGNRRLDKGMSREAAASRGMGEKVGRFNRWLLIEDKLGTPVKEYTTIISIRNKAGEVHREMTLPWMDDGTRINSARNFVEWASTMRDLKNEFDTAVGYFCDQYDHLIMRTKLIMDLAAEEEKKPTMFNQKNYPSASRVRNHFAFNTHVMPLPESVDFRVKLSDVQVTAIKSQIESQLTTTVMNATEHLFERLAEVARRVEHLAIPGSTVQKALARDIESVCAIAERLNIADDPYLTQFAQRIRKELHVEPVFLKTVPEERDALAARATAIINDMTAFMGTGDSL